MKNVTVNAQKETAEDGKQIEGAIVVAQCMDGVACAGMKHSFPLEGVCHSIGDLSTKTSGEWTYSFKIPDVLAMDTKAINAELKHRNVVVKGNKTKTNKQEILRQAYINKLPNKITAFYKQYKGHVYDLLKKTLNGVTFCCTRYKIKLPNYDNKWTTHKACVKVYNNNTHCPGTMSISIVNGIVGVPYFPPKFHLCGAMQSIHNKELGSSD